MIIHIKTNRITNTKIKENSCKFELVESAFITSILMKITPMHMRVNLLKKKFLNTLTGAYFGTIITNKGKKAPIKAISIPITE